MQDTPETPAEKLPSDPVAAQIGESLFASRTLTLAGEVTDRSAAELVRHLIALDHDATAPIYLFVSSPGGHVESGDSIHNVVRFIESAVTMIGNGWVGSAAAHVYLAVPAERRLCLPHTRFLIHQPSGGIGGRGTDIEIQAREILKHRTRIAEVIARQTGQPLERVCADIDRDYWLSAIEAVEYGLVSRVIERRTDM